MLELKHWGTNDIKMPHNLAVSWGNASSGLLHLEVVDHSNQKSRKSFAVSV